MPISRARRANAARSGRKAVGEGATSETILVIGRWNSSESNGSRSSTTPAPSSEASAAAIWPGSRPGAHAATSPGVASRTCIGVSALDRASDDVERALLRLGQQAADVLAQDPETEELNAPEEHHGEHERGPALDAEAEEEFPEHDHDRVQERREGDGEPEVCGELQGNRGE